jgi:hypothetical protein
MRKMVNIEFSKRMMAPNAQVAMHQSASMGVTRWVNKDIRSAEATGDWSVLLEKAQKQTTRFRNGFYK